MSSFIFFFFFCGRCLPDLALHQVGCLWPFSRHDSDGWAHEAIVRFPLGLHTLVASTLWRNLTPSSNKGSVCSQSPLGSRTISNVDLGKLLTTFFRGHLCCLLSLGEGVSPHLIPLIFLVMLPALLFLPPARDAEDVLPSQCLIDCDFNPILCKSYKSFVVKTSDCS